MLTVRLSFYIVKCTNWILKIVIFCEREKISFCKTMVDDDTVIFISFDVMLYIRLIMKLVTSWKILRRGTRFEFFLRSIFILNQNHHSYYVLNVYKFKLSKKSCKICGGINLILEYCVLNVKIHLIHFNVS